MAFSEKKPLPLEIQAVFDFVKRRGEPCYKDEIASALRLERSVAACCCDVLTDRLLFVRLFRGRHGIQYCLNKGAERVKDPNSIEVAGNRYVDLWAANHPLIGKVPYSVSLQGREAVRQWLQQQGPYTCKTTQITA